MSNAQTPFQVINCEKLMEYNVIDFNQTVISFTEEELNCLCAALMNLSADVSLGAKVNLDFVLADTEDPLDQKLYIEQLYKKISNRLTI